MGRRLVLLLLQEGFLAMAVTMRFHGVWVSRLVILLLLLQLCVGDDIVHNDEEEPKQPGCNNSFVLVTHQSRLLLLAIVFSGEVYLGLFAWSGVRLQLLRLLLRLPTLEGFAAGDC